MARKEKIVSGYTYHIYNRGVNYGNIFFKKRNWEFFLSRLDKYLQPEYGILIAYCLMPNHYHLLIEVLSDQFAQKVMQPLTISYTKAINKQETRVGPIFQGPFQARRVATNADLLNLSRYIHRNPVSAGFVDTARDWDFSSYRAYINAGEVEFMPELDCLRPAPVLGQFGGKDEYRAFVEEVRVSELDVEMVFD